MEKTYILESDPVPLARARFSFNGNHRVWDSQKQLKTCSRITLQSQHGLLPLFQGPLLMDITFNMEIPKSWSKKRQRECIGLPHICKPDLDNMVKFINDIASKLLYRDDATIYQITARKVYATNPSTMFTLKEI